MPEKVTAVAGKVTEIPLSLISPDPHQPRRVFDKGALEELAADIKSRGVLQPITVTANGKGGYQIKFGERRFRAAQLAKLKGIPALLDERKQTPLERSADQIAENDPRLRKDLNPIELAEHLARLQKDGKSVNEITDMMAKVGKPMSRPAISNIIRLADLPAWSKKMINEGKLTPSHGKYLLQAPQMPAVQEALQSSIQDSFDYGDTVTVDDIQHHVSNAVRGVGIRLNPPDWQRDDRPLFDIAICKGCKAHRALDDEQFCFDKTEFNKKQAAAKKAFAANPKLMPKWLKDEQKRKEAAKDSKASSHFVHDDWKQRQAIGDYFEAKLRGHLAFRILPSQPQALLSQLVAFAALGSPSGSRYHGYSDGEFNYDTALVIGRTSLVPFLAKPLDAVEILRIAQAAVLGMGKQDLRGLARHFKVAADAVFTIDEAWLSIFTGKQLVPLCKKAGLPNIVGLTDKLIIAELVKPARAKALGVPAELQKLFDEKAEPPADIGEKAVADAAKKLAVLQPASDAHQSAVSVAAAPTRPHNPAPADIARFEGEGGAIARAPTPPPAGAAKPAAGAAK